MMSVKTARILANLSQTQIANMLNISTSSYNNKENGRTEFTKREATLFANAVNMPENDIIFLNQMSQDSRTKF